MGQRILIDPVTRIEGHARITIDLDDRGEVAGARLHVTEFRGFERFCEGRSLREMPAVTSRICGICPVSHQLASARAGDALLAVEPPPAARRLRELVHLGQLVQSHALSFFLLSAPDWVLGYDSPPERRHLLGLAEARPEFLRDGLRLRAFGQQVIEEAAGRRIHPSWAVPGGVARALGAEGRARLLAGLPEAIATARRTLAWWSGELAAHEEEAGAFGCFPSLFLALVGPAGELAFAEGRLRVVDEEGAVVVDGIAPDDYREWIGEAVQPSSFLKSPWFRPRGEEGGLLRVGPLARLNACTRTGTPLADEALAAFRSLGRGAVLSSFHAHAARLVELLHGLERIERLLADPAILEEETWAAALPSRRRGVGAVEAPRGTLLHDYEVDGDGLVTRVNLLVATGFNAAAMDRTLLQIARRFLPGRRLTEGLLDRVEAGIRAFDPCLSCSTHAAGKMALAVELRGPDGALVDSRSR